MAASPIRKQAFPPNLYNKAAYVFLATCFLIFTGFIYVEKVPEPQTLATKEQVAAGKVLWQKHNCSSCHQLYGLGGYLGPDLTNTISKKGKAYAGAIMKTGTQVMPDFRLNETEIQALLAFLEHTDKSGRASVHDFRTEADGRITPIEKGEEAL